MNSSAFLKSMAAFGWGGKVTINSNGLFFAPNGMNTALHEGLEAVHIPLSSMRSARREFGWVTGIVVVVHDKGVFRFRCFGAKKVAESLAEIVDRP
jgi:hypothetical protein